MKKSVSILILAVIFLAGIFSRTSALAETEISVSLDNAMKVKEFEGGALYKMKSGGKMLDVIVYKNGKQEVYVKEKHGDLFKKDKITKDLKEKIEKSTEKDSLKVGIWFKDIDYSVIDAKSKEKVKISDLTTADEKNIQKYIETKRKLASDEYEVKNKEYFSKYIPNEKVLFISKYAPFIIAVLPAKNISKLSKNEDVLEVDMYYDTKKSEETSYSIANIHANYTRDNLNLKGTGIKIGVLEMGYADKTNAQLVNCNITFDDDYVAGEQPTAHATKVTSIIAGSSQGIVPNAEIYQAAAYNRMGDYAKIEWLLSKGVNVINYSAGYNDFTGVYSDMAKWIDHIAVQHYVTFVKSAGNGGPSVGITDPGMAYNGLTVGSIYDNNSANEPDWSDDTFTTLSAYLETQGGFKPDLTAPGEGIQVAGFPNSTGTSFAAPHASAVIAQILQKKPALKLLPCALNALLKAGTSHKTANDYGQYAYTPDYSNKEGAGVIDAVGAYNIVNSATAKYWEYQLANSSFPYYKQINITSTTKPVRVALTWLKPNTLDGDSVVERELSDLDLYVTKPDGSQADCSTSANNNTELVEFTPTVTGTYTIEVQGYQLLHAYENIGLAWNQ